MSRTPPQPRPALVRAEDGSVHPASARLSSLAVDLPPAAAGKPGKGKKTGKEGGKEGRKEDGREETVELTVTLSRADRKRLRRKAESYGWSAEEAAAHVLRVWVDA